MAVSKAMNAIREEAKYIIDVSRHLILFMASAIVIMVIQRRILFPVLECAVYYAELGKLWLIIFVHNFLTFALLHYGFYIIYYKGSWVSVQRCKVVELIDCKLWNSLLESQRVRLLFGALISPFILLALVLNSLRLFGYPLGFEYVFLVLSTGVSKLFGIFELGGYVIAILSSALDNRILRVALLMFGALFILIGARIEAVLVFELNYGFY